MKWFLKNWTPSDPDCELSQVDVEKWIDADTGL